MSLKEWLKREGACDEGKEWALKNCKTLKDIWDTAKPKWFVWFACRKGIISQEDRTRFARHCALSVAHLWDCPDVVRRWLETGDESLREESHRLSSALASASAWDSAWASARASASASAWAWTWASASASASASAWDSALASASASASAWASARDSAFESFAKWIKENCKFIGELE